LPSSLRMMAAERSCDKTDYQSVLLSIIPRDD
jgi:hypothetical protein